MHGTGLHVSARCLTDTSRAHRLSAQTTTGTVPCRRQLASYRSGHGPSTTPPPDCFALLRKGSEGRVERSLLRKQAVFVLRQPIPLFPFGESRGVTPLLRGAHSGTGVQGGVPLDSSPPALQGASARDSGKRVLPPGFFDMLPESLHRRRTHPWKIPRPDRFPFAVSRLRQGVGSRRLADGCRAIRVTDEYPHLTHST